MSRFSFIIVLTIATIGAQGQRFSYPFYQELAFNQPDSALRYVQFFFDKCDCETADSGTYYNLLGGASWIKGDLVQAADYLSKAISQFEAAGELEYAADVHTNLGNVFNDMKADRLALQSYRIAINNQPEDADGYNNMGTVYLRKGNLDSAMYLFQIADSLYTKNENDQGQVYIASNIGELYLKKSELKKATYYLNAADSLSLVLKDQKMRTLIQKNQSLLYLEKEEPSRALKAAHLSKKIALSGGFGEAIRDACKALYTVHLEVGNTDSALYYLEEATHLNDSLTSQPGRNIGDFLADYFEERQTKEKALDELKIVKLNQDIETERQEKYLYVLVGLLIFAIGFNIWRLQRQKIHRQELGLKLNEEKDKRLQAELFSEKLKAEDAAKELHYREKELMTFALKSAEMQNFLNSLYHDVEGLPKEENRKLIEVQSKLALQLNEENRWEDFKLQFEKVHDSFFSFIIKVHPELTANDLKLSALTLLNLSSKEIAAIQAVKHTSVDIARHRLRKKLGLESEQSLIEYLRSFT